MRIVRGDEYADAPTNEGFVSYFQDMPLSVFPDAGRAPLGHPELRRVPIEGRNLEVYREKLKKLGVEDRKMLNFSCMAQSYRSSVKHGTKFRALPPADAGSKFHRIVQDVMSSREKTLVIVHRENGFRALQGMFEDAGMNPFGPACNAHCWASLFEKPTARDERTLAAFNDPENRRGENMRVMMVDAKFYSEGVSFKDVRRVVLADVPPDWAAYKQRLGRALRFCGHKNLPLSEWFVDVTMYLGTTPDGVPCADEHFMRRMLAQRDAFELPMRQLAEVAVDRDALRHAGARRDID
jgi:hypothetical protein